MHYSALELSKNGQFTIIPIDDTVSPEALASAITPTSFDYLHVNLLYCGGKELCVCTYCVHVPFMYVYICICYTTPTRGV